MGNKDSFTAIQDSKKNYSGKYTDHNENEKGHQCNIQHQYIIYIVGDTREWYPAVSRCGLKLIDPTQVLPGLTHTATGAIMIAPVSDESLRWSSIIGHYNHSETNHNQHHVFILHQTRL